MPPYFLLDSPFIILLEARKETNCFGEIRMEKIVFILKKIRVTGAAYL